MDPNMFEPTFITDVQDEVQKENAEVQFAKAHKHYS